MKDYNYSVHQDGHGLKYPGFSVVFIHTFSIHHLLKFFLPDDYMLVDSQYEEVVSHIEDRADKTGLYDEIADHLGMPITFMKRNIENQIFVLPRNVREEDTNVRRFSLRGFDFEMPIIPQSDEDFYPVTLKGHVNIEMSLFFGHTASITYRFLFDGNTCTLSEPVCTDHIISLLSIFLGAEYWSTENKKDDAEGGKSADINRLASQTDINLESLFYVSNFCFDDDGKPLGEGRKLDLSGKGRTFDALALIYKKFIYNNCTDFKKGTAQTERIRYNRYRKEHPLTTFNDYHYAMVDIWENIMHPVPEGENGIPVSIMDGHTEEDLFSKTHSPRLSEADIVNHIRDYHKEELIGLLTMYPGEWPYRDAEAYDEICGQNIAIDTDDLVLVGHNLCMVLGTYGRRGADEEEADEDAPENPNKVSQGVDWSTHLRERRRYHVSWPEYLLILQMVLAKKYIIGFANDQLIHATLSVDDSSSDELIGKNAELSMRLSRLVLQLDVVKYSKFASHVVMFDRTTQRLRLNEDMERLSGMMDMVDNSLHNLSDSRAVKSDFFLNIILAIISCASTFELFFQNSEMPFLSYFGIRNDGFSAVFVAVVAAITLFALLLVLKNSLRSIMEKLREYTK